MDFVFRCADANCNHTFLMFLHSRNLSQTTPTRRSGVFTIRPEKPWIPREALCEKCQGRALELDAESSLKTGLLHFGVPTPYFNYIAED